MPLYIFSIVFIFMLLVAPAFDRGYQNYGD